MGMFSWCCKGCGHELHEGELVRLNGCEGQYDGYGGAGGFDYGSGSGSDPSAWHVRCYNAATDKEKLDDSPSKHASNQGFGLACLENLQEYDAQDELSFKAVVRVDSYDSKTNRTYKEEWYVVDEELMNQMEYERLYSKANGGEGDEISYGTKMDICVRSESVAKHIWDKAEEVWNDRNDREQYEKLVYEARDFIENHIGMKSPKRCSQSFDNFEELKLLVERQVSKLPNPNFGYEISIFGKSEGLARMLDYQGLYYNYCKLPKIKPVPIEGEFYPDGRQKNDFVPDGTFSKTSYMHGKTAEELGGAY